MNRPPALPGVTLTFASVLSREVDDRIDGQLSRKAELDAMRTSHKGLSSQVRDLSNLINSLKEDKSLGEMEGRSVALKSQLESLQEKLVSFELLEKVIQDREARAEELAAKLDGLTAAIEQNGSRASVLDQEMEKLDSGRREWLQEVHRIGEDQKAIRESAAVTGQQIEQIKTLTAQLEDKQAKLNASETKIERYEEHLQALEDLMQGVDRKIDDVEKRQEAVDHVRLQVGNLFESTEKTRNDAMKVLEARQEIVDTKQKLELLLREASVCFCPLGLSHFAHLKWPTLSY